MKKASTSFAERNLTDLLIDNPCRGIVIGMNEEEKVFQLAWIMSRSDHSKNRVYTYEDEILKTEAADPSKVKDPSLIIYNVMRSTNDGKIHVVSNGDQTDTLFNSINYQEEFIKRMNMQGILTSRYCEPDAPNFTPRITGAFYNENENYAFMSLIKADFIAKKEWIKAMEKFDTNDKNVISRETGLDHNSFPSERAFFELPLNPGFGYCLTTYVPGSKDLNSFEGEPVFVPLNGDLETVMKTYWNKLEPQWKVSLCGKEIYDNNVRVADSINKNMKVGAGK